MFVGEIGRSRREFLYDITFWEARRIVKGYRRRHILKYQLMRINIWASMFCMGNPDRKQPEDIFKLYFDDDDAVNTPPLTEEERAELQAEIDAWNANIQSQKVETP